MFKSVISDSDITNFKNQKRTGDEGIPLPYKKARKTLDDEKCAIINHKMYGICGYSSICDETFRKYYAAKEWRECEYLLWHIVHFFNLSKI